MICELHLGGCGCRRNVEDLVVVVHGINKDLIKLDCPLYSSFGNDTSLGQGDYQVWKWPCSPVVLSFSSI